MSNIDKYLLALAVLLLTVFILFIASLGVLAIVDIIGKIAS